MVDHVQYYNRDEALTALSEDITPYCSVPVWHDFPNQSDYTKECVDFFDDFTDWDDQSGGVVEVYKGWKSFGTGAACTITQVGMAEGSISGILLETDAADDDECVLWRDNTLSAQFWAHGTYPADLWYEARIKLPQIVTQNVFVGLTTIDVLTTDQLFTDGDAVDTTGSAIGFRILAADSDGLDTVYWTAAGAEAVVTNVAHTVVALEWIKLGMRYKPNSGWYWYINGVEIKPDTATAAPDGVGTPINTAGFPDTVLMAPGFGIKASAAAQVQMYVNWVRCAQRRYF